VEKVRELTAETRAHTDASLGAERADTDSARSLKIARTQRAVDDLIEHDRLLADASLRSLRLRNDSLLAHERLASPALDRAVVLERRIADDGKSAERSITDAHVERQRQRADAGVEVERREQELDRERQEAHRQDTDEQLSEERSRADATAAALGETREALENARSEQAHHHDVLGIVAHDLRNPLHVITLNAQSIAEATTDATREDALEVIRAAARMNRLLADLLDVARIESKTLRIAKRPHDVGLLLTEVLRSYRPLFADRGMTFSVGVPIPAIVAFFDRDRIVQVLSNLLGNALKFTPREGAVHLHAVRGEGQIEFVLRDSGPGIHSTALPHVFERFWQIDSDTRRGLGLGLYICEKIVALHGGRIWAESEFGNGATFRFTLPLDDA
jgi:signal transduction histidine kinase